MPEAAPPRVFISYSHDSEAHRDRVLELSDRLRCDGIEAMIDQYVQSPPQGWPAWCETEIDIADFVLMVCTETYLRRVRGKEAPRVGHGVLWEARLIRQDVYDVRERAVTMGKIADILQARGQLDEALKIRNEEELLVYERLGDVRALLVGRANLAIALLTRGRAEDRDEARRLLHLALELDEARRLKLPEAQNIEQILGSPNYSDETRL